MIDASFYQGICLFIVTLLTLITVSYRRSLTTIEPIVGSVILCIFLVLFIGFRPVSYLFVDMMNYNSWWGLYEWEGFEWGAQNVLFDNLYAYMSYIFPDTTLFFALMAALYFIPMLVACRKMFPSNTMIVFLVCLAAFSTFSYGTNGIKAGVASSFFLVALAYRDKMWVSILFLLLSWGFHHSMQMPVVAYILTMVFKKKEWYFYGWLFCLAMAVLHISFFQTLFADFSDESGAAYLTSNSNNAWGGRGGFRMDFVVYSAMPILIGYYVKYKYKLKDKLYDIMLNIYLTCNGVWMLCMYAEFTNRIAYLSWFMYPIILIYPCYAIADKKHPLVRMRKYIVMVHLVFTLFMSFVYYA